MMRRTAHRPLPHGDVKPEGALVFGLVLEALAFALLWSTVNLLSAVLAVSAMLFYVFVYTIWLKPRSPQNIVIGGAAGAVPVLVGWAAVTGSLAAPAWVLFAIVFFWTPPHFWALSLKYFDDYKAAGIPMLPVAKGIPAAVRQIVDLLVRRRGRHVRAAVRHRQRRRGLRGHGRGPRRPVHRPGDPLGARHHAGAGHTVVHLLEHVPRAPLRRRCRRHPPPLRLTLSPAVAPGPLDPGRHRGRRRARGRRGITWAVVAGSDDDGSSSAVVPDGVVTGGPREVGDVAPDFTLKTFDGKSVQPVRLRGQAGGAQLLGLVLHPVPQGVPAVP